MQKQNVIEQIREFNRFYTVLQGFLSKNYLETGYSATETRVLFEIYRNESISAYELTNILMLDKGYLSRLIRGFEQKGLLERHISQEDGRMRVIALTEKGSEETKRLIQVTNHKIEEMIDSLSESQQGIICDSMKTIMDIFERRDLNE